MSAASARRAPALALVPLALWAALGEAARGEAAEPGGLTWWTTHALVKVRPDDPPPAPAPVELAAARNEFEPFQLVLRAQGRPLKGVDAEATDLVAHAGGAAVGGHRIASRHVAVYLERTLRLAVPSSVEGDAGEWPDPLVPRIDRYAGERRNAFPFDLAKDENQPLWLEIYVPPETPAGVFRGEVRVSVGGTARARVPVKLEVWPFLLPSTSSLRTSFGFSGIAAVKQHLGEYTGEADVHRLTRLYTVAALRHRVSLHGGSMTPPPARFTSSEARVDWTAYDREMGPFLDGRAFGRGEPLPGARLTSVDLQTLAGLSDERKVLYWRAWSRHFRARGWLDRLFLYLWDEPGPGDYAEVARLGRLARRADPGLRVLLTEQLVPGLSGVVDLWVTLVNCLEPRPEAGDYCERTVPRSAYATAERRGARLWWYQSCASHGCDEVGGPAFTGWPSYVIDAPPVASRIMPWLAWARDIEGELYYNTVEAYDGGADPWLDLHLHGGNGDGTLFYPGTPSRIGGTTHVPIESLRLKLIREGLEDYEYLTLLSRAGKASLARAWTERISQRTYRWQRSPEALYAARQAIGRELAGKGARSHGRVDRNR